MTLGTNDIGVGLHDHVGEGHRGIVSIGEGIHQRLNGGRQ